jgi:periplasmic protein TonB
METKTLVIRTWDDLVFADRNREYGAYKLRKAYSERLMMGLGISTALMIVLFFLAKATQGIERKKVEPTVLGSIIFTDPPIFEIKQPKPPKQQPIHKASTNTTIRVVTGQVEETTVVSETVSSSLDGSETGTDVALIGDVSGTGDVPIIANPVPEVLITAEVMPSYEGGYEAMYRFIRNKIRYPSGDKRIGTEGTVYVSFVVNGDGTISQVSVLRGISSSCDQEAMRVIAMLPGWIGGKQNGNPVAVRMVLPIKFEISE